LNNPSHILSSAISRLQAMWWRHRQEHFLVIVNWHQVTPSFDPTRHYRVTWTAMSDFEKQIDYLASDFQVLPLDEAIRRLKQGRLRGACAALAFDDGDISMADHVLPYLRRRHLPATFFINSAYLDSARSCWVPILAHLRSQPERYRAEFPVKLENQALQLRQTKNPALYNEVRLQIEGLAHLLPHLTTHRVTAGWLAELDGEEFAIGAHGHEHQRYSMMPVQWQRSDLAENIDLLSQFKAYRPIFAVPFGRPPDWTEETIAIARELALEVVLADGGVNIAAGPYYYRIPCDSGDARALISEAMARGVPKVHSLAMNGEHTDKVGSV